ncbi:hypothetical protein NY725_003121 [Escherichia coli]|nr:hypothetical protein [Escherichia coli]EHO1148058.1 hypothetical protein [Escherichia coli]EHQ4220058.1 hypothetical protein [Escherichia coli]EHT9233825.1 hypothetical protein [Escherichia coli]EIN8913797.1 hypothetical protein [Escherichia coli]EIQ8300816.1 hypothetical protein [Escherichia coli]
MFSKLAKSSIKAMF